MHPGAGAWVGPLAVLVIVLALVLFTALGLELMRSLPVAASDGAAH